MRSAITVLAICVATLTAGCGMFRPDRSCQKTQPYESSKSIARLKVPPGMDAPDTRDSLVVPEVAAPEAPRSRSDACLDVPPSYRADAAAQPDGSDEKPDEKRTKKEKK
jgi:uncharacterized lipoprotein